MSEKDSNNTIEHKCYVCGYEVEFDWSGCPGYCAKGDESFIKIMCERRSGNGIISNGFNTDKPRHVDYGLPDTEKAILLGCPKCGTVSFKII